MNEPCCMASLPFGHYSFPFPLSVGGWDDLGGLVTEVLCPPKMVTRPSTDRARRRVTLWLCPTMLPPWRWYDVRRMYVDIQWTLGLLQSSILVDCRMWQSRSMTLCCRRGPSHRTTSYFNTCRPWFVCLWFTHWCRDGQCFQCFDAGWVAERASGL